MIGREKEIALFDKALSSERGEMIAIYGRRRIGKTYLVEEYFKDKNVRMIKLVGESDADRHTQISNTNRKLLNDYDIDTHSAKSWELILESIVQDHKLNAQNYEAYVLFIDELPWLATQKSGLVGTIGRLWEEYFKYHSNLSIVLCGSAAAWMIDNIVNDKGGLHHRITHALPMSPFSLKETQEYLHSIGFEFISKKDIIDLYIAFGGVAQYLSYLDPKLSVVQNISALCFSPTGRLRNEFSKLFIALFGRNGVHKKVVEELNSKKSVLFDLKDIAKKLKITNANNLYVVIEELREAGFVEEVSRYKNKVRNKKYRLIDPFSRFHLKWIANITDNELRENENYWQGEVNTQSWISWSGVAFESVCHMHILQIKNALGISGVHTSTSYWQKKGDETSGAQIDMLMKRQDRTVMLIEIKYANTEYEIKKAYEENLRNKIEAFREEDSGKNSIQLVMLSTYGVKKGKHSGIVVHDINMDKLFQI